MNLNMCIRNKCNNCKRRLKCFKEDVYYTAKNKCESNKTKVGERGGKVKMGSS